MENPYEPSLLREQKQDNEQRRLGWRAWLPCIYLTLAGYLLVPFSLFVVGPRFFGNSHQGFYAAVVFFLACVVVASFAALTGGLLSPLGWKGKLAIGLSSVGLVLFFGFGLEPLIFLLRGMIAVSRTEPTMRFSRKEKSPPLPMMSFSRRLM